MTRAAMTGQTNNLVERLGRKAYRREIWHESDGTMDAPCDAEAPGAEAYDVNPDGPDAIKAIQSLSSRIAVLEDLLAKYGDRVRMATAWPESIQPAIDEAIQNAARRSSITKEGTTSG